LRPLRPESDDLVPVDAPSSVASLDRAAATRTLSVHLNTWAQPFIVTKNPLGAPLSHRSRQPAYIVRRPGVPTALMPFYGRTPDEAAHDLSDWLARAHQRGRWRYIARLVLIDGTTEMVTCECGEQIAARFHGAA